MNTEAEIGRHYSSGRLLEAVVAALAASGKQGAKLTPEELAPLDEFHVGGLEATQAIAKGLELHPGLRLLDVGCGIGGPARYFAAAHGCQVHGLDLTEEFVTVARQLTEMAGLAERVEFHQASALKPPFAAASFDRAVMIHVGMHVSDKAGVFRAVRGLLKPQGRFAIFDLVRTGKGALRYPAPWAGNETTSFVASADVYREALAAAGFRLQQETDRTASGVAFIRRAMAARAAAAAPPPLGLHLLMRERTPAILQNVLAMLEEGPLSAIEFAALAA